MKQAVQESIAKWARESGVPIRWPDDYVVAPERTDRAAVMVERFGDFDFTQNPCIDYGRVFEKIPGFLLQPTSSEQLTECVRFLGKSQTPYKIRAAGHCSGGQTLIAGGAVIDIRGANRIIEDRPDDEEIRVEGGMQWLALVEHLATQGRRPITLTGNPRTSIAGGLSVGGFGDTSHIYGIQGESVSALTLIIPDGTLHHVRPGDELFDYTMAGRGQLGVIADVTLKTMRRPMTVAVRRMVWPSLHEFIRDMAAISSYRLYEFVSSRINWRPEHPDGIIQAFVGNFAEDVPRSDPGLRFLAPIRVSAFSRLDLLDEFRKDPHEGWAEACPALELIYPLPHGLDAWRETYREFIDAGFIHQLRLDPAVVVVPRAKGLPVAPMPASDYSLVVVLRPEMDAAAAVKALPVLRAMGAKAMDAGARLYLMSVEPDSPRFLQQQFGSALAPFRALKKRVDPLGLCNPGLL